METVYAPFIYDGFALPQEQIHNEVKVGFAVKEQSKHILQSLFGTEIVSFILALSRATALRIARNSYLSISLINMKQLLK